MEEKEYLWILESSKINYDKNGNPIYFNCNSYIHMAKEYRKPNKETGKYYKYNKVRYLVKEEGFVKGLE